MLLKSRKKEKKLSVPRSQSSPQDSTPELQEPGYLDSFKGTPKDNFNDYLSQLTRYVSGMAFKISRSNNITEREKLFLKLRDIIFRSPDTLEVFLREFECQKEEKIIWLKYYLSLSIIFNIVLYFGRK